MAPPTQAGKFKPRKPAKPIQVGAAPIAVPSNTTAATSVQRPSARQGGQGGRGGRSGGRGGRAAAGQQQGQVFFTGSKRDATKRGSVAASAIVAKSNNGQGNVGLGFKRGSAYSMVGSNVGENVQEEVVGLMEEGVGSMGTDAATGRERTASNRKYSDSAAPASNAEILTSSRQTLASAMDRFMYDSDSSDDEARQTQSTFLQPIQLPIPPADEFVAGEVAKFPSKLHPMEITLAWKDRTTEQNLPYETSPFASTSNIDAIRKETDGFFLCQLPTRLIPFQATPYDDQISAAAKADFAMATDQQPSEIATTTSSSQFCNPAVQNVSFDNVLVKAEPGQLGRMVVHKSGRTVLELIAPSGQAVRMNVAEGLTCAFRQYIACIDPDKAQLVALGNVHKTIVITPRFDKHE
ncbi:hypothetical protein MPSEU_000897000 [Mayamaea pseudoterrestris]|nr:hypothetical protein MPSEU_000897000 [Mayamaea pseudoterrestris]